MLDLQIIKLVHLFLYFTTCAATLVLVDITLDSGPYRTLLS